MPQIYSLLEFVRQLVGDDGLRADYAADPQGVLADHGLDGLAAEDVRDALLLVDDARTVEYDPDHGVESALSFDPGAVQDAVQYFSHYAGLSTPAAFDVDLAGDIDDLDGYAVAAPPAPASPLDDAAGVGEPDDAGSGFGHGFEHAADVSGPVQPDDGHDDAAHHVPADPGAATSDPSFDEPGAYDEFGASDEFDPPQPYDNQVDEPGHPH